jgi:hypothetical protein
MAVLLSILALIVAASAAPVEIPVSQSAVVATRELKVVDYTSMIENEFSSLLNECKDVIFVWARGTAEAGNMVRTSRNKIWIIQILLTRALSPASHLVMCFVVSMVAT